MSAEQVLMIEAGGTFRAQILWLQEDGTPHDLTNGHAVLTLADADSVMTVLTVVDGLPLDDGSVLTLGGLAGTVDILLASATTADLPVECLRYDLFVTPVVGGREKVLRGRAVVQPATPAF